MGGSRVGGDASRCARADARLPVPGRPDFPGAGAQGAWPGAHGGRRADGERAGRGPSATKGLGAPCETGKPLGEGGPTSRALGGGGGGATPIRPRRSLPIAGASATPLPPPDVNSPAGRKTRSASPCCEGKGKEREGGEGVRESSASNWAGGARRWKQCSPSFFFLRGRADRGAAHTRHPARAGRGTCRPGRVAGRRGAAPQGVRGTRKRGEGPGESRAPARSRQRPEARMPPAPPIHRRRPALRPPTRPPRPARAELTWLASHRQGCRGVGRPPASLPCLPSKKNAAPLPSQLTGSPPTAAATAPGTARGSGAGTCTPG